MVQSNDQETAASEEPFTTQSVLNLLGSSRTRYTVRFLADTPLDKPVPITELTDAVIRYETGTEEIDESTHKPMHASLYLTHVPRLEDCGAVTTASEDELLVIPRQRLQTLTDILDYIDTRIDDDPAESRWPGSTLVSAIIDCVRRYRYTSR